jgi:hypothetical protein
VKDALLLRLLRLLPRLSLLLLVLVLLVLVSHYCYSSPRRLASPSPATTTTAAATDQLPPAPRYVPRCAQGGDGRCRQL